MRPVTGRPVLHALAVLGIALLAACASGRTTRPARGDRNVLTHEQLRSGRFVTVYDAIAALRSNWLRPRGPESFVASSQVWVYSENGRVGDVETLRTMNPRIVESIRWFDGVAATGRWGVGHAAGVILVSSWQTDRQGLPIPPPARPDSVPPDTSWAAALSGYVAAEGGEGRFALAAAGAAAPVYVSADDHAGVRRVANDLRADVARVTGVEPRLVVDSMPAGRAVVLLGTLGRSPVIDRLVREGKVDTAGIAGRWETFALQVVERPLPGVERALVIAGSDKRGTIFGAYDLSQAIGVSPWHWWADVAVRRRDALHVLPGRHTRGTPAVKYRGIFINDEAPAFAGWARETFGGINHRAYERVFELILRLKGNYLWPAMWGSAFYADDPESPRKAEEYGVVIGTSHHEPMMRAHAEWARFGRGAWNYATNDSTLRRFWADGIRRMGANESLVTLGMRGDGDEPMTEGTAIGLLERIVADQRRILADVTGRPPAETPQVWALYKEVQDYYDKGMRVPEDVTLLFADDNWGNVRRLPAAADRGRAGGFGMYYHFDYVGGPRNYKWLNTNPIARVWEQMHLAYRAGVDRLWIVNVGDVKPMEFPIQFFLDYAWAPDSLPAERLPDYTRRWAAAHFGAAHAAAIADVMTTSHRYAGRRKPELLDTATYSLSSYREAETVVAGWRALEARAEAIRRALPPDHRDAYHQLVLHPIQALANLHDLYVTVARNRLHARQGRASTNDLADRARRLFARDAEITRYYNDTLAGGKWSHMMDQTHIGYTSWQEPPRNVMPRVDVIEVPPAGALGVAWEGQAPLAPPRAGQPPARPPEPALPPIDAYNRQTRYVELFNRGRAPVAFTARAGAPWVQLSDTSGTIAQEGRVWVSVDWRRAPVGTHRVPIVVEGPGLRPTTIHAVVHHPAAPARDAVVGFVEADGHVSMEAEHHTRAVGAPGVSWLRIPGLGRTLSGMTMAPVTAPARTPGGDGARLEYAMHLFGSGEVTVRAYVSPTLAVHGRHLRYAVSFDDEPPQIVDLHADGASDGRTDGNRAWEQSVANAVKVLVSTHRIAAPGAHVLRFWAVDPGVVLQKLVVDLGGVRPSYLGPPESFRRDPAAAATTHDATSQRTTNGGQ